MFRGQPTDKAIQEMLYWRWLIDHGCWFCFDISIGLLYFLFYLCKPRFTFLPLKGKNVHCCMCILLKLVWQVSGRLNEGTNCCLLLLLFLLLFHYLIFSILVFLIPLTKENALLYVLKHVWQVDGRLTEGNPTDEALPSSIQHLSTMDIYNFAMPF